MTLDLKYRENLHEVSLSDYRPNFSVNVGKSKILCTKTVKFADGIDVRARAVDCPNTIITVSCYDSDLFDRERLELLVSSLFGEGVRAAIAVSFLDKMRIKTFGSPLIYETITAGIAALSADGVRIPNGECVSLVDGVEHVFVNEKGSLTFSPEVKYLY